MNRQTARLRLRSKLEQAEAVGADMAIERHRFDAIRAREPARVVSAFNLFETPEDVAARLASLADLSGPVLEPSAGLGRLYRAIRARSDCHVTLVETNPDCAAELYRQTEFDDSARLVQGDFLEQTPERLGRFAAVVMNPPFKQGRDIKHVRHAMRFAPLVVAIVANGPRQNDKLRPLADSWEVLPRGTFDGTRVEAVICTFTTDTSA